MKPIYQTIFLLFFSLSLFAQQDTTSTLFSSMDEVVVTASKTATKLGNVTSPISIITKKNIQQAGSLRLKDILQEQAGMSITNGFGAGIQMQGLNPDYTLILLNGAPLVGRTAGVLDLNRIGITNIKKIEVVKGPSSSLYGSEAMAGVINIITENTSEKKIQLGARYGFGNPNLGWASPLGKNVFKNSYLNFLFITKYKKAIIDLSSNAFYLDAISFRPYSSERITQPIWRFTNQLSISTPINNKNNFTFLVRNGYDQIKQNFAVNNIGGVSTSYGKETNNDLNINSIYKHSFNENIKSSLNVYATFYKGYQKLNFSNKPDSSYIDEFKQHLFRAENQNDFKFKNMLVTIGAGYIIDQAYSTRYDNVESKKQNQILYAFAQHEWTLSKKLIFTSGVRYDHNKIFAAAFSPKFSFRYIANKALTIKGSIGRGFKAPDFRQLYLNFTNNAAGGYSVLGSIDAIKIIQQMQTLGQLSEIKDDYNKLSTLKPEFSTGINLGGNIFFNKNIQLDFNGFRNDIDGLIDVRQVATKLTGAQIFSYINIKKAYTQGLEFDLKWKATKTISLSTGYQLLETADKDELANIKAGKVYTRNADGTSRLLLMKEYTGLANRSKHMGNIKITYENKNGFFINTRLIYKSQWYVGDRDGNGLLNTNDEKGNGYLLINMAAGKTINKKLNINIGMDNVTNYQDVNYLPNLSGRMIYLSI
ncbi:MAG: TonB-dependent receptor, partial [Sphingobacteriales bacterium]|nr:TonB-dependent receptor [Sphingobacteriales bacterium]